eukprot:9276841-Pyramimonas_sp.AAC.1
MHTLQRTCRLSHIPVDHQHMRMTEVKKSGLQCVLPQHTVLNMGLAAYYSHGVGVPQLQCGIGTYRSCALLSPQWPHSVQATFSRQAQQPCTTSTYNINVVRMSVACWSTAAHNQQLLEV